MNTQLLRLVILVLLADLIATKEKLSGQHRNLKQEGGETNTTAKTNTTIHMTNDTECSKFHNCEKCVGRGIKRNWGCRWCGSEKRCIWRPFELSGNCKWLTCSLSFKTVAITVGVIGGVLLIVVCCCLVKFCRCVSDLLHYACCCCCCCCSIDAKEDRRLKSIERQLERQARRQEVMLKFGMRSNNMYGSTKGYSQFHDTPI